MSGPAPERRSGPGLALRRARALDAEALARLHVANWQEAYEPLLPPEARGRFALGERLDHWRRVLAATDLPTVVAEVGSPPVLAGFVTWRIDPDDPEVEALHVAAAWRGRGVGGRLLKVARQELGRLGVDRPHLFVLENNAPSRRFYEAAGWTWDGTVLRRPLGGFPDLPIVRELRYVWSGSSPAPGRSRAPL